MYLVWVVYNGKPWPQRSTWEGFHNHDGKQNPNVKEFYVIKSQHYGLTLNDLAKLYPCRGEEDGKL